MASENKFCPYCGKPVAVTDVFCPHCGKRLTPANQVPVLDATGQPVPGAKQPARPSSAAATATVTSQSAATAAPQSTVQSQPPRPELVVAPAPAPAPAPRAKRRWPWWLLAAVVVLAAAGTAWYYAKPQQLNRLADAASAVDPVVIASAMVSDEQQPLTAGQVLPLSDLYQADPAFGTAVAKAVRGTGKQKGVSVVVAGRILGLFPRYRVQLSRQPVTIKTSIADPQFSLAGTKVQSAGAKRYVLPAQLPGLYTVKIQGAKRTSSETLRVE